MSDQWAQWLQKRRDGNDPEQRKTITQYVWKVREQILQNAQITPGETLLDVGAGEGLIAFEALRRVGEQGKVIFSDISQILLDQCQARAQELGIHDRCQFLRASADNLQALEDASVDIITTRSVLIYLEDKRQALREFHRVLKPNGRLSIFEPIGRFAVSTTSPAIFMGYDLSPLLDIAQKVQSVYNRFQPPETNTLLNFDERDLLACAEAVGFTRIHLELRVGITPMPPNSKWDVLLQTAPNPLAPTLQEAIDQALTESEAEQFIAYLRPLVEKGEGIWRRAEAFLLAVKH